MRNILALAGKEVRSYFSSPIAYIVIGVFALLYGYFYIAILSFFVRQSMQMSQFGPGGGQAMNVNQQMLRPLMQNVTILVLFMLPAITMRTYAEEKRSGTIELLLTSPITDFQIVMGKFLGALVLYAVMLAVTLIHVALLFVYGQPECAAARRLLHLHRDVHLDADEKPGRVLHGHVRRVPVSVGDHLDRQRRPVDRGPGDLSVDHRPLRGLQQRGNRHDAPDLLLQLHHLRSLPDRQVGRHRTMARLTTDSAECGPSGRPHPAGLKAGTTCDRATRSKC
jgi:hypothetical protein